jgi:hypothetical protein
MGRIKFVFILLVLVFCVYPCCGEEHYAKVNGWDFCNWDVGGTRWDIFQQSFIGISENDALDLLLYSTLYYELTKSYVCFGMCLMATTILKEEGHLGFCKPVYRYPGDNVWIKNVDDYTGPADTLLAKAIRVMQAHQASQAMISCFAERAVTGEIKDAMAAYNHVEYYLAADDPPLISVIAGSGDGHALIAYDTEEVDSDEWKIYIYDPNRSYRAFKNYYDMDSNYIKIETTSNPSGYKWSFRRDKRRDNELWEGDMSANSDGFIFAYPSSMVIPPSTNPFKSLGEDLSTVFFAGNGGYVAQITDEEGKKFYKTDTKKHESFSDIEDNPGKKIASTVRFPFITDDPGKKPEVYFIKDARSGDLNIDIVSKGKGYELYIAGGGNFVKLNAEDSPPGKDKLVFKNLGTAKEEINLSSKRSSVDFNVELYRSLGEEKKSRTFKLSKMKVRKDSPIQLRFAENQKGVLLKSEKDKFSFDLEIQEREGEKVDKVLKKGLNVEGKAWQSVIPSDWKKLKDAEIKIRK